jgi:hypothetical protein
MRDKRAPSIAPWPVNINFNCSILVEEGVNIVATSRWLESNEKIAFAL